jgi:hypothetical protein
LPPTTRPTFARNLPSAASLLPRGANTLERKSACRAQARNRLATGPGYSSRIIGIRRIRDTCRCSTLETRKKSEQDKITSYYHLELAGYGVALICPLSGVDTLRRFRTTVASSLEASRA